VSFERNYNVLLINLSQPLRVKEGLKILERLPHDDCLFLALNYDSVGGLHKKDFNISNLILTHYFV